MKLIFKIRSIFWMSITILFISIIAGGCFQESTDGVDSVTEEDQLASTDDPHSVPVAVVTGTPSPDLQTIRMVLGDMGTIRASEVPVSVIEDYRERDYCVESITYGQNTWLTIINNQLECDSQEIVIEDEFPSAALKRAVQAGKYVTDIEYGDGQWVLILSKGTNILAQKMGTFTEINQQVIDDLLKNEFQVTSVVFAEGAWYFVQSKLTDSREQYIKRYSSLGEGDLDQIQQEKPCLVDMAYGQDQWVVVFEERPMETQKIASMSEWAKDYFVDYAYEQDFTEIRTSYGNGRWYIFGLR